MIRLCRGSAFAIFSSDQISTPIKQFCQGWGGSGTKLRRVHPWATIVAICVILIDLQVFGHHACHYISTNSQPRNISQISCMTNIYFCTWSVWIVTNDHVVPRKCICYFSSVGLSTPSEGVCRKAATHFKAPKPSTSEVRDHRAKTS